MQISKFLNENYMEAALYILYRSTASYIDGLKNSSRKVVYTVKKSNIKTQMKVSALGSRVVDEAQYLHGDSINGVVVTLAKNYCGENNLPLLEAIGAFGTRFSPTPAASRYIFTKPTEYFDLLFRKEDEVNLISQEFEGDTIEPVFYVPTLPLLFLNGTSGIGVGFSSDIFPRSIDNVIKITRAAIEGKNLKNEWFVPGWQGFRGTVENVEGSWIVKGLAKLEGRKLCIDELPISWNLKKYQKLLQKLKEEGKIIKYLDYSEDDIFKFEVWLTDDELKRSQDVIWKDLGLVETMTENLTCMDEKNSVREYKSVKDIFKDFYAIKIKYLKLRIKSEIARLSEEENALNETYRFIQEVIKGTIVLKDKKKAEDEAELKKKGYTIIEKLLNMPLYSITIDKANELQKKWKNKIQELEVMKAATPEKLWSQDIDELEAKLVDMGILKNGNK